MKKKQLIPAYCFLSFMLMCSINPLQAQEIDQRIGSWKNYLPFKTGNQITQSEDQVFYTTRVAVLAIDKEAPFEPTTITKLSGLTSSDPTFIKYIPQNESLIVSYNNSTFDQIFPSISFTYDNLQKDGNFFNREILALELLKDSLLYFCTAYGVVEFNPIALEFGFTVDLEIPVVDITYLNGFFYAATEEGLYKAEDSPNINLKDVNNWRLMGAADNIPEGFGVSVVANYKNNLYFSLRDTLFKYTADNSLEYQHYVEDHQPIFLSTEGEYLTAGFFCSTIVGSSEVSCDGEISLFDEEGFFKEVSPDCIDRPRNAIEDQFGRIWSSDSWGKFRLSTIESGSCNKLDPTNSPVSNQVNEIALRGDEIWLSTNGLSVTTLTPEANREGIYNYVDGVWSFHKRETDPVLAEQGGAAFHRIILSPDEERFYVGTNLNGLVEVNPGPSFAYYSKNNSVLEEGVVSGTVRIAGLAFDAEGNLWMSNNNASRPMAVLKTDGTIFNNFDPALSQYVGLRDVVVDFTGYKWYTVDERGLLVYDDNGTIETSGDDRFFQLNSNNSNMPEDNRTRCLEVDLDGEIWVGTSKGVISFECGESVFDGSCPGVRQIVEVDGILANLLETEDVWSIAVDGANRKWMGTTNGVFLMSPNGKEQLAFFNTKNSPLPDNLVTDIKVHPETGEVFFATGRGLVSYREGATIGAEGHIESNVFAYPNPVRPDYEGPIAIKGLTRDADIKITDISGQLIYETKALGGQAIWDGRDYNGRKAASGVYLVFSTSETTFDAKPNTLVTKLLFIN